MEPSQYHSANGVTVDTPPGDTYENAPLVNFVHRQTQEQMKTALREVRSAFRPRISAHDRRRKSHDREVDAVGQPEPA